MRNKQVFELLANGNLNNITTGNDKIYQGAVGVTEYYLKIIENGEQWRPTDIVFINLILTDKPPKPL